MRRARLTRTARLRRASPQRPGWGLAALVLTPLIMITMSVGPASAATKIANPAVPRGVAHCALSVSYPAVYGTTMTGVGSIYCTRVVALLVLQVNLVENGRIVASSVGQSQFRNYIVKEARKGCISPYRYHNWQVVAIGVVIQPPYSYHFTGASPVFRILC